MAGRLSCEWSHSPQVRPCYRRDRPNLRSLVGALEDARFPKHERHCRQRWSCRARTFQLFVGAAYGTVQNQADNSPARSRHSSVCETHAFLAFESLPRVLERKTKQT